MDFSGNPKYRRINEDIAAGRFYDSLQHVLSASKRAVVCKKFDEAFGLLHHFSVAYVSAGEYAQSLELMGEYLSVANRCNVAWSAPNGDHFVSFFRAIISASSSMGANACGPLTKSEVVSKSLKLVESALEWGFDARVYLCLGEYWLSEGDLSKAQKYLVHAQDVEFLFKVLEEWASHVPDHERPFVYLRCVLIQLASGDFAAAKCLLLMLNQDFENAESVPLPLQLAYLLTELGEHADYALFKVVVKTYKCVIEADPNFLRLVYHLREHLFPGLHDPDDPLQMDSQMAGDANNPLAALFRSFMM